MSENLPSLWIQNLPSWESYISNDLESPSLLSILDDRESSNLDGHEFFIMENDPESSILNDSESWIIEKSFKFDDAESSWKMVENLLS